MNMRPNEWMALPRPDLAAQLRRTLELTGAQARCDRRERTHLCVRVEQPVRRAAIHRSVFNFERAGNSTHSTSCRSISAPLVDSHVAIVSPTLAP